VGNRPNLGNPDLKGYKNTDEFITINIKENRSSATKIKLKTQPISMSKLKIQYFLERGYLI
jgi:hypothetical protein